MTKKITVSLSILAIITGFIMGVFFDNSFGVSKLIEKRGFWENFIEIFYHNLLISFVIIISGFTIYFLSSILVFSNFLVFGESIYFACQKYGLLKGITLYIHGIFEIPAIILSLYISYEISYSIIKKIKNENFPLFNYLKSFKKEILALIVLFLIGALVESFLLNIAL
ncbi:stage II sporulation protein M [Staphylococcus aureus]|uniref:AclC n=1 Tax=Staphylococcus aureus TaxID=1280 RepID=X4Y382_STAAU|nr:stage II sporulation protein M [Staphylococcus aureus]AHV78690.1 AclC [Staphylococcus aureus]ATV90645.1 AclC [Staphylococcus aureus]MDN4125453.1 stage II sporulation protein M [Staphylococcus aureus]PCF67956.1 stage II sporulation protein M [Staphylococcus aureus]